MTLRGYRGYISEYDIVNRINKKEDWYAKRCGGASTFMPDVLAINNNKDVMLFMEAKSGTSDNLYIPQKQIEKCYNLRPMFSKYTKRPIICAFRFATKTRKKDVKRVLKEYFYIYPVWAGISKNISCNYNGVVGITHKDGTKTKDVTTWNNIQGPFDNIDDLITYIENVGNIF